MLGIRDADFEETAPAAPTLVITRLSCSLAGAEQGVFIAPNTPAFKVYGKDRVAEQFACHYGLNDEYRNGIVRKSLVIAGNDGDGSARILELDSHRFFIATLFRPQLSSRPGNPHPLIVAFLKAAIAFRALRQHDGAKT